MLVGLAVLLFVLGRTQVLASSDLGRTRAAMTVVGHNYDGPAHSLGLVAAWHDCCGC